MRHRIPHPQHLARDWPSITLAPASIINYLVAVCSMYFSYRLRERAGSIYYATQQYQSVLKLVDNLAADGESNY